MNWKRVAHWNQPPQRHLTANTGNPETLPRTSKRSGSDHPAPRFFLSGTARRENSMDAITWMSIARHQLWYRELLVKRVNEWRQAHVGACADIAALKNFVRLGERVEKHERRIRRHGARMLALAECPSAVRH